MFLERNRPWENRGKTIRTAIIPVDPRLTTSEDLFNKRPAGPGSVEAWKALLANSMAVPFIFASPQIQAALAGQNSGSTSQSGEGLPPVFYDHNGGIGLETIISPFIQNGADLSEAVITNSQLLRAYVKDFQAPADIQDAVLQFKTTVEVSKNLALTMTEKAAVKLSDFFYRTRFGGMSSMEERYKDSPKDLVDKAAKIAGLDTGKAKIEGMHQLFAVLAARQVFEKGFKPEELVRLYKEVFLNIVRDSDGKAFKLKGDQDKGQTSISPISDEKVNKLLSNFSAAAEDEWDESSATPEMPENQSYGQWSPEMRAVATMEAMQLCTIPQAEKQNYEVVLFASTIPLTADNLLIPQELQGVQLLVDKAGNVIGIAARVGVTGMLAPGLIMR